MFSPCVALMVRIGSGGPEYGDNSLDWRQHHQV